MDAWRKHVFVRQCSHLLLMAFGFGGVALLLDFTGWYTIVGAVLALMGCGYAVMSPQGRARKAAVSLNALAVALAALIYASFLLSRRGVRE